MGGSSASEVCSTTSRRRCRVSAAKRRKVESSRELNLSGGTEEAKQRESAFKRV